MKIIILAVTILIINISTALAGEGSLTLESNKNAIDLVQSHADYLWTLIAAALVFFMQAGFAMVEAGFTRAKNTINIMMKNLMDFSIGSLAFWAVGFGLMFGVSKSGWFGTTGFFLSDFNPGGDPWVLAFWMFQVVFAATAATIVSGAMAERTKFSGYLIYSILISALIYPIFGSWAWGSLFKGSGWLENFGFIDFAGSTVVHSVGGWAAPLSWGLDWANIPKTERSNRSSDTTWPWPPWGCSSCGWAGSVSIPVPQPQRTKISR